MYYMYSLKTTSIDWCKHNTAGEEKKRLFYQQLKMVEGLELAPRVRNLAPYPLRAGSDYCSIRANPAHASSGVVLLQQLIDHNSYGTFSKSVDVLKNILQRALENNK